LPAVALLAMARLHPQVVQRTRHGCSALYRVPPPQTPGMPPPPQVSGAVQVPQLRVPPQPLPLEPQLMPSSWHVCGVQLPPSMKPHCPGVPPPPHVWGGVQGPQLMAPPQPSPAGPQPMFCCAQVWGTHVPASTPPHWAN